METPTSTRTKSSSNSAFHSPTTSFQRSISPSGRFCSYSISSSSSSAFASPTSGFNSQNSVDFFTRSSSPTRVNLYGNSGSKPSAKFSNRTMTSSSSSHQRNQVVRSNKNNTQNKKTCLCSPTTHPGSFRCSLHKNQNQTVMAAAYSPNNRLDARRSVMTNSLVRIGTVEGEWVKRALTALIRPSSHQQRRRAAFQTRPSRLSIMSKAEDS
ncbi:hypothetical protein RJ641_020216 [Dillenia turbinata]|uniref:Serine-rich protein n=1 Tax=Dillenia turbinata TaxID=194707 RepID=A0AAN8UJC0_9MAGN